MTRARVLVPALILAAALAAPALADDTPIATASTAAAPTPAAPMTTAEQIDNYLKTSPARALPTDAASGVTSSEEPRKVHGEVDIAVGTGGYRSAYARADMPVGKTGVVSVAVQQGQFNGRGGGQRSFQNLGLGFAFGEAAGGSADSRCRRGPDGQLVGPPRSHLDSRGEWLDREGRPVCRTALPDASD